MRHTFSESARVRELHRYFQPWLELYDGTAVASEKKNSNRASRDKTLLAFAQLGALRLNVKRGLIQLFDTDKQYILCEATQTVSLQDNSRHNVNDHVWLGYSVFNRDHGVSELVLKESYTAKDDDGVELTSGGFVCADLRTHETFKDRPYVVNGDVLYYAGVPIKTSAGITIGSYVVVHDKCRPPLNHAEFSFMIDIAETVFEHFDRIKSQHERLRGEKMVKGITTFIEGGASLPDDRPVSKPVPTRQPYFGSTIPSVESQSKALRDAQIEATEGQDTELHGTMPADPNRSDQGQVRNEPLSQVPSNASVKGGKPSGTDRLLIRAARMIRQSTNASGVLFFDASASSFGDKPPLLRRGSGSSSEIVADSSEERIHSSASDDDNSSNKPQGHDEHEKPVIDPDQSYEEHDKIARIVGYSFKEADPSVSLQNLPKNFRMSVKKLKRCILKYPRGKVFTRRTDDALSSDDSTAVEKSASGSENISAKHTLIPSGQNLSQTSKFRFVAETFNKMLPNAEIIIWITIWDYTSEKWFAGGLVWSDSITSLVSAEHDLLYMKAFGNCIISEIARMNAERIDKSKSTFIASISHELRSPLHGILGSTEFLKDTAVDGFQAGLIHSIDHCGKTLLETIDNVLMFSKINSLSGTRISANKLGIKARGSRSPMKKARGNTQVFDISMLVEEVFEALYAGQIFRNARKDDLGGKTDEDVHSVQTQTLGSNESSDKPSDPSTRNLRSNVVGILNIARASNWWVKSQPGAVRRIVMNLLGNALKYTSKGYVQLSLKTVEDPQSSQTRIILKIKDSGKGISSEFLRDNLFMPFSQQDSFENGTGLGLSIVRQLVDSLHGRIEIKSEESVGTEAIVSLSLPSSSEEADTSADAVVSCREKMTRPPKVCLLDSRADQPKDQSPEAIKALVDSCQAWFDMEVFRAQKSENLDTDFFIYMEPPSTDTLLQQFGQDKHLSGRHNIPVLIVCTNTLEASALLEPMEHLRQKGCTIDTLIHPLGPRKLAKAFSQHLSDETVPRQGNHTNQVFPQTLNHQSSTHRPNPHSTLSQAAVEILRPQPVRRHMTERNPQPSTNSHHPSVLIVDDNEINLRLLSTFMKRANIPHVEARNGLEALKTYKAAVAKLSPNDSSPSIQLQDPTKKKTLTDTTSSPKSAFDYVIMDISMPVMDGLTATREIRAAEKSSKTKPATVIALTGLGSDAIQKEARQSGVDYFLTKPVRFKDLRSMLDHSGDLSAS